MLTDEERARIEVEERYRAEIRQKFETKESKAWKIWNSAIVLWALSAVVISGLGGAAGCYIEERKDRRASESHALELKRSRLGQIGRLDDEIGYRLSQVQGFLYGVSGLDVPSHVRGFGISQALISLHARPGGEYLALYPEYEKFNLPALVAELRRYLSLVSKKDPELDRVLESLSSKRAFLKNIPADAPSQIAGAIDNHIVASRWRTDAWYFLKGDTKKPPFSVIPPAGSPAAP